MKFVAAPSILVILATSGAAEAIFRPPTASHALSTLKTPTGWLLGTSMRGGSMGKLCSVVVLHTRNVAILN